MRFHYMKPINLSPKYKPDATLIGKSRLDCFLKENEGKDPNTLRLKYLSHPIDNIEEREFLNFAILQLEARSKYNSKFKNFPDLLYPSMLSGEQASHFKVSEYHAGLASSAKSLLDLTGGLGIDFMSMAKKISDNGDGCVVVEIDPEKEYILRENLNQFNLRQAITICGDSIEAVKKFKEEGRKFDVIFVDPARRDIKGDRVYDPADCQPDIVSNLPLLLTIADKIIIKNSPMVDIKKALELFPETKVIHLVSVRNECKELLIEIYKGPEKVKFVTADILSDGNMQKVELNESDLLHSYEGKYADEKIIRNWLKDGDVWIYEPSVTQMKLGGWNSLSKQFPGLVKSSPNSHIFFSNVIYEDFPGRILLVNSILDRKSIKDLKKEPRNVVTRNYPLKAVPLMKKLRVNSGSDKFIYGLTISSEEQPLLLDTELY